MFAHLRTLPQRAGRSSCTPCLLAGTSRNISVTHVRFREPRQPEMTFEDFMSKIGKRFENADRPRNWLGGEVVEFVFLHCPKRTWFLQGFFSGSAAAISYESFLPTANTCIGQFENRDLRAVYVGSNQV